VGYPLSSLSRILNQRSLFQGKRIVTLGTLYPFLGKSEDKILAQLGLRTDVPKELFSKYLFVDVLGAASCHSLDVSDYQKSEIICNLNQPLPEKFIGQWDVVIDAGTLEHLSNLTIALENLFKLLKNEGIYYFGVPCNNWVDHGFFQFSPTFFIDFCIDNPNFKLFDLHISTAEKTYCYSSMNPWFRRSLFSSRRQMIVGGVIQKQYGSINLNLTQSKYREQYKTDRSDLTAKYSVNFKFSLNNSIRHLLSTVIEHFCFAPWIPLKFKEWTLNCLYRFKNRLFTSI
jgi:hypothetical protein